MGESSSPALTKVDKHNLLPLGLIIVFGIFASTLPQPLVLGRLPLQFLLKNDVHVTREQMAAFFFWCTLPWYLKPFAGILTDAFPFFGTRRRHYLLFGSVLSALSWIGMGFLPHKYGSLLFGAMAVNLFIVMASAVTGAFLVEAGQRMGATGRLTALRMFVSNSCSLIQGPLGGLLATAGFIWATGANAFFALTIFPIAYIFLKEQRIFSGAFAIPAAILYGLLIKHIHIRILLFIAIAMAATGTLFYLFYSTWTRALLIESQSGFFGGLAELAILDLAARATPRGCEGLGYSLMLSIRNVAAFGADVVGSYLADHKWQFAQLVYLSAGTTAIVLILLPLLPAALMRSKDTLNKRSSGE
jgi:hypothetical protein